MRINTFLIVVFTNISFVVRGQVKEHNVESFIEQLVIYSASSENIPSKEEINNVTLISQIGSQNLVKIIQQKSLGIVGNVAIIIQRDNNNTATLVQEGSNIKTQLLQTGSYNHYDATAIGTNISSNIIQDGYGNHVQSLTTGQSEGSFMRQPYEVRQTGNNNSLQLNHGADIKPYTIEQKGNNMKMSIETIKPVFQ